MHLGLRGEYALICFCYLLCYGVIYEIFCVTFPGLCELSCYLFPRCVYCLWEDCFFPSLHLMSCIHSMCCSYSFIFATRCCPLLVKEFTLKHFGWCIEILQWKWRWMEKINYLSVLFPPFSMMNGVILFCFQKWKMPSFFSFSSAFRGHSGFFPATK